MEGSSRAARTRGHAPVESEPSGCRTYPADTEGPVARRVLEALLRDPFTEGNDIDVLRNGKETFPALLAAIDGACRSVDLLWFSWGTGAVSAAMAEALARSARRGVRVRVVLDASSRSTDR